MPIRKTKWSPWPLIGWDIFYFSSETAERNSTKLDRKQDLYVLYQVCVFEPIGKTRWPPRSLIGWDIFDFSSERISTSSTKSVFLGPISKKKMPPWPIRQKDRILYSGARYVAIWVSFLPSILSYLSVFHWYGKKMTPIDFQGQGSKVKVTS